MINLLLNLRNLFPRTTSFLLLYFYSIDIPRHVKIGKNFTLAHRGNGVVIHPRTTIGHNVTIYQQVTIGRADIWNSIDDSPFEEIIIHDDVTICAGAKIICKEKLVISRNCIIGANSVLTKSTKPNEVWCGIPAKLVTK